MSFIWPLMLFTLFLVPLFAALYLRLQYRRRQFAASYGPLGYLQGPAGSRAGPGIRRHIPPIFFMTGLAILLTALARPQTVVSLPRVEGTVILAFDVSGSMAAEDIKPTRMEAAKAAARVFIEHQPATVKIGIVAFSDGGFSVLTPTNDPESIVASINRLSPQRSTSIGRGILASLQTIAGQDPNLKSELTQSLPTDQTYPSAVIVLLTDGENTASPDPLEAAQLAADHGVRIYTIGIGSAAGTVLSINGFTVHTQLDEPALQAISQLTKGDYFNAQNEEELRTIYENITPQLLVVPEKMEVTSLFAGASILVMLIGGACSLLWFGRLP